MREEYLVCYDIADAKRLRKVAKVVYGYALGGQKSVLETPLEKRDIEALVQKLEVLIDPEVDKVNIVRFKGEPLLLGRADFLRYEQGVVIV